MMSDLHNEVVNNIRRRAPGLPTSSAEKAKRRRIENLDLNREDDRERWQIIHNDTDRYEFISEHFTQVKGNYEGEYRCRIIYYEIGDNLPLSKTEEELRAQDDIIRSRQEIDSLDEAYESEAFDAES